MAKVTPRGHSEGADAPSGDTYKTRSHTISKQLPKSLTRRGEVVSNLGERALRKMQPIRKGQMIKATPVTESKKQVKKTARAYSRSR